MKHLPQISLYSILKIEASAYPEYMQQLQECSSFREVAEYSECSLDRLVILGQEDHWYAIIALHKKGKAEFVDLAKMPNSPVVPWGEIVSRLHNLGIRKLSLDARESTSYKVIIRSLSLFRATILKDEIWDWDGELMHSLVINL